MVPISSSLVNGSFYPSQAGQRKTNLNSNNMLTANGAIQIAATINSNYPMFTNRAGGMNGSNYVSALAANIVDYADTDPDHPYMYHCHLANHEDEGMMGQFLVQGTTALKEKNIKTNDYFTLAPNPANDRINITLNDPNNTAYYMIIRAANGRAILMSPKPMLNDGIDISYLAKGLYTIQIRDTFNRSWYSKTFIKN
jgi:hypothetical protein